MGRACTISRVNGIHGGDFFVTESLVIVSKCSYHHISTLKHLSRDQKSERNYSSCKTKTTLRGHQSNWSLCFLS